MLISQLTYPGFSDNAYSVSIKTVPGATLTVCVYTVLRSKNSLIFQVRYNIFFYILMFLFLLFITVFGEYPIINIERIKSFKT